MAFLSDFDISGYGLSAQRFRMNLISSNIANANTSRTAEGGPYRRREVVFKAVDFGSQLNAKLKEKTSDIQGFTEGKNVLNTTNIVEEEMQKALGNKIFRGPNGIDYLGYENPLDDPAAPQFPRPAMMSVVVDKVVRDDSDFIMKYDPQHPDANERGYVMMPNVNPVIEMADMIEATRAYQANVAAFQSAKNIATSAIDMLRQG